MSGTPTQIPTASTAAGVERSLLLETHEAGCMAEERREPSWPWSMWARMQKIGRQDHGRTDQASGASGSGLQQEMSGPSSRETARSGVTDSTTSRALERSYQAKWPSLWSRAARWMRPLWDIYFVVCIVVLYALPDPGALL